MQSDHKTAVVLLNLGGPDSLHAVESFLFNLFYDKAIITLPNPLRWIVAKIISKCRNKLAQEIYQMIGGASPIMKETEAQRVAIQEILKNSKVFICMRHWHPMSAEVVQEIKAYNPSRITFLPLYPQFSTTTTGSSISDLQLALKNAAVITEQKVICCYYDNKQFINAHVELIQHAIQGKDNITLFFSAHGLPQKIIDQGDPYQWQINQTVDAIMRELDIKGLDYKITYQSKVGPMKWLEPSTEHEIGAAAALHKTIVIVPIAFVSEHVETLVELDIEYAKIAAKYDAPYIRVPTLSLQRQFINALAQMTLDDTSNRKCPEQFSGCICK